MAGGYDMYAGQDAEEALALLEAQEYGHLDARGHGATKEAAELGPSFVHYAPKPQLGERGEIWVHLANTNPLLAILAANPQAVLTVSGAAAYIPSHWMDSPRGVPTSYYSWAQFDVKARLLTEPESILEILAAMLERFQPEGKHPEMSLDDRFWQGMVGAITGLKLSIVAARSRFKLGQNRPVAMREVIAQHLEARGGPVDAAVSTQVRQRMKEREAEPESSREKGRE